MRNVDAKHSGDSWSYRGRWQVNLMNTLATLGDREDYSLDSVIRYHNVVVLHEISHVLSGVRQCWQMIDPENTHWDAFLLGVI